MPLKGATTNTHFFTSLFLPVSPLDEISMLALTPFFIDRPGAYAYNPRVGRQLLHGCTMGKAYFAHPTAVIDEPVEIGDGTKIWHFCHVMAGARIGRNSVLGQNVYVGGKAVIGNGVKIQNNVSVYDAVTLEDDVFCGPSMVFTNVMRPRSAFPRKDEYEPTLVRRGATLGANCTILCGVTIGEYAMVGAGCVVTDNISPYAIVVGVAAKPIGWACQCGERLPLKMSEAAEEAECGRCKRRYVKEARLVKGV